MRMSRRSLLALPTALLPGLARGDGGLRLEPAGEGLAALTGPGVRAPLVLAAAGARMLPGLALGGVGLAVVQVTPQLAMDWAVLALRLDGAVVALALEPWAWRGPGGARMTTRIAVAGAHVVLRRDSAIPAGPTLWRREAWTDYLAWVPPAGLADAPARAVLGGTRQAEVAAWRRRAAGLVAGGRLDAAGFAAAGLQDEGLSLSVSAQPSMRQPAPSRTMV